MASIVQPPRAFQVVITFVFPEDSRSDDELSRYVLDHINPSLSLGTYGKGAGVIKIPVPAELAPGPKLHQ